MMLTIDADDAWWPPTFTPEGVSRTLLAWWIDARGEPQHAPLHGVEDVQGAIGRGTRTGGGCNAGHGQQPTNGGPDAP